MPNMDKTGPQGQGPQTGRGQGPCGGGLAWGGRGQGWGRRSPKRANCPWWDQDTENKDEVLKRLEDEKKDLESAIDDLKKS